MIQRGLYGGGLSATNYGGSITVIDNAVIANDGQSEGFQYDDGTFIRFDDGSIVEAT